MKKTLKVIDKRIDEFKNKFSNNNHFLELTDEEYKILKDSLTLIDSAEILKYRGIPVIKQGKK